MATVGEPKTIQQRVVEAIASQLGEETCDIRPDYRLVDDLGADSLDVTELMMELEEEFSDTKREFKIPDSDADRLLTVGDVVSYVEEWSYRQS